MSATEYSIRRKGLSLSGRRSGRYVDGGLSLARALITGGAGFIGARLANRLLRRGHDVVVLDNLSRRGSRERLALLQSNHPDCRLRAVILDILDFDSLAQPVQSADWIFHLAGQVAVTSSLRDPIADFEANGRGTLNLLEAARRSDLDPVLVYSSTNKVYGPLDSIGVFEASTRYFWKHHRHGIDETTPLDFFTPYGCSKGTGDQYFRDYHRVYGLKTVVLRQSCVYGPWQSGTEDQGWLSWFVRAGMESTPLTIWGDGKQVRDVLFVEDLLDLFERVLENSDRTAGEVFNVGGGAENSVSIWAEFQHYLRDRFGRIPEVRYVPWRAGDQKIYISDIRKASRLLNWKPAVSLGEGIDRMVEDGGGMSV